jgi:type VI secretion system protein ImpF
MKSFEPSLFDRLLDSDPQNRSANPVLRQASVNDIKASVARDIENLLNHRMAWSDRDLRNFPQCKRSVLTCGVKDFVGLSIVSFKDQQSVCAEIERALANHERRLRNVKVNIKMDGDTQRAMTFSIEALLVVNPLQEPVSFDALMLPTSRNYAVKESGQLR